jgi:glycosyltransferase involved in cell wall biosynthesis
MRILVLSFYYPPDIGPGSLRAKSIVDALIEEGPPDLKIDVITTMPNRYHSLNIFASKYTDDDKISINRIALSKHKNGMFDQAKAFILFSFEVRRLTLKKKWDIVIATSSRLMTASLATYIAKRTSSKIYLDIRDLFTNTINDVLKKNFLRILMPIFYRLEKWTFQSADKLNIISVGFSDYIKKITPNLTPSTYTNGVDEMFLKNDFSIKKIKPKPLILYTGNIGDGQGLHKIIPGAANALKDIQFRLIGEGSARKLLIDNNLFKLQNNIEILKPVLRKELINEYQNADILFLHLNDYKAFHKVLPSKIFEYAATGKPILAGVSGYAAEFLTDQVKGVEIFNPCDVESMKLGLEKLLNGPKIIDRNDFCLLYSRKKIMKKLAKDILTLSY